MVAATYQVDRIDQQLLYLSQKGTLKRAFLFEWTGYDVSEASWQETGFGDNAAIMQEDIGPLRSRLKTDGEAELEEHHTASLHIVQYELKHALRLAQGENATDLHVSAFVRLEPRTYARLFGDRLVYLVRDRELRAGTPARRTYKFNTTASYYSIVWPRSRLASLAHRDAHGTRRILAVEARCTDAAAPLPEGLSNGALVYVLTVGKVYRPGAPGKIYTITQQSYTMTQQITVRYTTTPRAPRNNFRQRGALMAATKAQWAVIHGAMPRW